MLASKGINVSGRYIKHEDGQMVNGFRVTAIGRLAARIWFWLVECKRAPWTWSQASVDVVTLYNNEMCRQYPELRYCADNWKAQQVATKNYVSWYKTHGCDGGTSMKSAGKRKKHHGDESSPPPPPNEERKKVKLDDPDLHVCYPVNPLSFTDCLLFSIRL